MDQCQAHLCERESLANNLCELHLCSHCQAAPRWQKYHLCEACCFEVRASEELEVFLRTSSGALDGRPLPGTVTRL